MAHVLQLLTSSICNFNCSYCFLTQNACTKKYNEIILQSWEDESYITNAVKMISKLGDVKDITEIQFQGGESSLTLSKITPYLHSLKKAFPNWKKSILITNFSSPVSQLTPFIKEIEQYTTNLDIQLSIDGFSENKLYEGHFLPKKWYDQQFNELFNFFKDNELPNLSIIRLSTWQHFPFKAFLSWGKDLETCKQFYSEYASWIREQCARFSNELSKVKAQARPINFPQPYEAESKQEGIQFAQNLSLIKEAMKQISHDYHFGWAACLGYGYVRTNGGPSIHRQEACPAYTNRYPILPDGSLCMCHRELIAIGSHFSSKYTELIDKMTLHLDDANFNDKWEFIKRVSSCALSSQILSLNLIQEMAKSNLISEDYKFNPHKAFDESFLRHGHTCPANNLNKTNIYYLPYIEEYLQWLNGAEDIRNIVTQNFNIKEYEIDK